MLCTNIFPGNLWTRFYSYSMNLIWSKGRLPSSWKHAVITPIPKIGKYPKHPNSYRPIALTSTLCKIMVRIIVNRLNWYCNKYGMFNKYLRNFEKKVEHWPSS